MPPVRVRYETIEFGHIDIHVRVLRDNLQYMDSDGTAEKAGISSAEWPFFGVIWPSGKILAHHMLDYNVEGKRILEVGCGIGLASLILNYRKADITATDRHPEAEHFLNYNTKLNEGIKISFIRTGWADMKSELGLYDLIIGSDVLYEREHAVLLAEFINNHADQHCDVVIVDPGRGHHACFSKKMIQLGYSHDQIKPLDTGYLKDVFKGRILSYSR